MELADQYARQYAWRAWPQAYALLPAMDGARVLDLGCAIGDQTRDFTGRGAQVVGVDADEALLAHARARRIPQAEFLAGDVRDLRLDGKFDGLWASFLPAYLPDLRPVLARWRGLLRPGGWIALTEVSGLFLHAPLAEGARDLLKTFVLESRETGRYDFDMGSRLADHLRDAGFQVQADTVLPDAELSFQGPASPDVLQAWEERLGRMRLLLDMAGRGWPTLAHDWLQCLSAAEHASACRVHCCVARLA